MNITDNSVSGLEDSSDDAHDAVQALPRCHIIQHPVIVANGNNDDDMQVFALIPPVNNANAGNNVHAQGQGNGDAVNGQAQDNGLGVQVNQMAKQTISVYTVSTTKLQTKILMTLSICTLMMIQSMSKRQIHLPKCLRN